MSLVPTSAPLVSPMPRLSARQARAREVPRTFLDHHTACVKAFLRRKNQAKRAFARAGLTSEDAEMNWELPADLLDMPWR
jgi:hypothetical protein